MITATKNNLPASINAFQEAKDKLKKISIVNSNDITPLPTKQIAQEEQQERTLALITYTEDLNAIINHIEKDGFTVINTKTIQLSLDQAQEFYMDHLAQNYYDKMVRWLSSGSNICALVLEKKNAVNDWRFLMGPTAYKKARKSNPNSIRALFGKDASQNASHGSDSEANAKKEIDFIFADSSVVDAAELHHQQNDDIVPVTMSATEEKYNCISLPTKNDFAAEDKEEAVSDKKEDTQIAIVSKETLVDTITEQKEETPAAIITEMNEEVSSAIDDKEEDTPISTIIEHDIVVIAEEKDVCLPMNIAILPADIKKENVVLVEDKKEDTVLVDDKKEYIVLVEDKKEDTVLVEDKKEDTVLVDNMEDIILIDNVTNPVIDGTAVTLDIADNAVTESDTTQEDIEATVSNSNISKDEINTCNEITPDASLKDEQIVSLNDTVIIPETISNDEKREYAPININVTISDTEVSTITPPTESNQILSATSSDSLEVNKQDERSTTSIRTDALLAAKSTGSTTKRTAIKTEVKKEAILPSSSRIRPPSIKRGHNGNMIHSGEPIGRNRITNNKISSANSSAGTTRIARLSPSATMKTEPSVIDKKKTVVARDTPRKPVTKVSKNLPRVAMMPAPKQPTKEDEEEGEKKTKKRGSSTKSFISRLTAPTVASQNKKADNDATTTTATSGVSRRATLSGKRSSAVRPTSSTSKEITTRSK